MTKFTVPTRGEVSESNQAIFDNIKTSLGMMPNLYAVFAHSDTALGNYLALQNAKTGFSKKEKEVINLVVSQVNECRYCQSAHTVLGKLNGFTEEQIISLRQAKAPFDKKLDALAKLAKAITENKGRASANLVDDFITAGYTKGHIVDLIIAIADKVIMNYLHNLTEVPIDFPVAPELELIQN